MSIEFRRGGRKVSEKQFFKGMKNDIRKKAEHEIERKLSRIIDPETGAPVKYEKTYRNGEPHWNIRGSKAATEQAKNVLGR
jgi:hypothetical protein